MRLFSLFFPNNNPIMHIYTHTHKKYITNKYALRKNPLKLLNKGSKSGDYEEIREKQFTKLLSNGSLLLQNVKEDREGFYLCQAHNGIGSGISKVIQLKVNCKYTLMSPICILLLALALALFSLYLAFVCHLAKRLLRSN